MEEKTEESENMEKKNAENLFVMTRRLSLNFLEFNLDIQIFLSLPQMSFALSFIKVITTLVT